MSLEVNEFVQVKKTGEIKQISEIEIIDGMSIIYMSDMSSYSSDQLIEKSKLDVLVYSLKEFIEHEKTKKYSPYTYVPEQLVELYYKKELKNKKLKNKKLKNKKNLIIRIFEWILC
jgi:hypothetical protein